MNPDPVPRGTLWTLRVQKSMTRARVVMKTTEPFALSKISIVAFSSSLRSPRGWIGRGAASARARCQRMSGTTYHAASNSRRATKSQCEALPLGMRRMRSEFSMAISHTYGRKRRAERDTVLVGWELLLGIDAGISSSRGLILMDTTSPTFANRTVGVCAILLSAIALAACHREPTAASTEHAQAAAAQITADYLRERIAEFSADEIEGRAPATPADARARAYLIEHLLRIGFEPAGPNGTLEQPFDVIGVTAKMPQQWVFERNGKSISFEWWNDFIAASGTQRERGAVKDAEVVFVGYGIQAPEYDWDDFKGQDLKGKVFLMLNNDPDWDPDLFGGDARLYYGRWTYK